MNGPGIGVETLGFCRSVQFFRNGLQMLIGLLTGVHELESFFGMSNVDKILTRNVKHRLFAQKGLSIC